MNVNVHANMYELEAGAYVQYSSTVRVNCD